jgi:hypothetical protein
MDTATASDDVIELIAAIEKHRLETEADHALACNEALRKLHELLEHEREALQSHGTGTRHAANVEAVTAEIEKIKTLAGKESPPARSKNPLLAHPHANSPHADHQVSLESGARLFPRIRARRTMGRSGR